MRFKRRKDAEFAGLKCIQDIDLPKCNGQHPMIGKRVTVRHRNFLLRGVTGEIIGYSKGSFQVRLDSPVSLPNQENPWHTVRAYNSQLYLLGKEQSE